MPECKKSQSQQLSLRELATNHSFQALQSVEFPLVPPQLEMEGAFCR
jgi:hypothetical protein